MVDIAHSNVSAEAASNFCQHHITVFYMLWTIAIVLVVLWLLGVVTSNTLGGFIHILVVLAIIVVLIRVIRGEKVL